MTLTFDLHDEAYYAWRAAGVRGAVLVHVDAHHDAAVEPEWKTVDAGNYVRAAIRDGIVADVRWAVPDPIWDDESSRAIVLSEAEAIAGAGVPLSVGPLETVAPRETEVLLDIDADYLFTAAYEQRRSAPPLDLPWCWPDALAERLTALRLRPRMTTIATSVTGGFTPYQWTHLAREMALRLDGSDSAALACFDRLRAAARLRHEGRIAEAVDVCRSAADACPGEAAALVHLAHGLAALGRTDEAREMFARGVALDPGYAHAFRTRGPYLLRRGRYDEAEAAFREAFLTSADDGHAFAGLALVALARGDYAQALDWSRRAIEAGAASLDAWRAAGASSRALGDAHGAIRAYEQALLLGLRGAAPMRGPWAANPEGRLIDPAHWDDHAALADLYELAGDPQAASVHRRMARAGVSVLPS
jgi:Flp pilus assembly protein TadD